MDKPDKRPIRRIEDLEYDDVINLLNKHELKEFIPYCEERMIDGRSLGNVTEGIIKLWKPKINANKLIIFIDELKSNPGKFLDDLRKVLRESTMEKEKTSEEQNTDQTNTNNTDIKEETVTHNIEVTETIEQEIITHVNIEDTKPIESQYQTVKKTRDNVQINFNNVEEIIKQIVPAKSFLYRHQARKVTPPSYLPMEANLKRNKFFRLSGYDYPIFDWKRFSKPDPSDRGYYPMKRNSKLFVQKTKSPENKRKYKSISTTDELKYPEDHFYEDLCYTDIDKPRSSISSGQNVKPYRVKIQELFQSFKLPFFKKNVEVEEVKMEREDKEEVKEDNRVVIEREPVYENTDSMNNMYDSVHDSHTVKETNTSKLPVEDYLEPVQLNKEYCDVSCRKEDSLLGYILSIFDTRFGYRRETNEVQEDSDSESHRPPEESKKWREERPRAGMVDRPLPVPVESEPFYMNVDRTEAENLLLGEPNGTFLLRPSSQPNHAYTISVTCNEGVHNVGLRRRADGRFALGYSRRGERTFPDVTSLVRHHRKRRLLLVVRGEVIGGTTLNDSPQYYQTPCSLPVRLRAAD